MFGARLRPIDFTMLLMAQTWAFVTASFICHNKIERKGSEKSHLSVVVCIQNTDANTCIICQLLSGNAHSRGSLMDFDASVPIDQTEPSLTAERTLTQQ
jgi:hypothetical protein